MPLFTCSQRKNVREANRQRGISSVPGFQNAHVLKGIEGICGKDEICRRKPHSLFSFRLENDGMRKDIGSSQSQGGKEIPVKANQPHGRQQSFK